MDHGLETEVDLAATNDLGDILPIIRLGHLPRHSTAYTGIVWLKQSNLDSLFFEISLGLSQVQRGVVGGGVPKLR